MKRSGQRWVAVAALFLSLVLLHGLFLPLQVGASLLTSLCLWRWGMWVCCW